MNTVRPGKTAKRERRLRALARWRNDLATGKFFERRGFYIIKQINPLLVNLGL